MFKLYPPPKKKGGRWDWDQQICEEFQTSKKNKAGATNFPIGSRGNAKNIKKKIGKHKSQYITKMKSDYTQQNPPKKMIRLEMFSHI